MKVIVIILSLILVGMAGPTSAMAVSEIELTEPHVNNHMRVNDVAIVLVDMTNNNAESQQYILVLDIRDEQGATVYLKFQQGVMSSHSTNKAGIFWIPQEGGMHTVRMFVISSFEKPSIISSVTSVPVTIKDSNPIYDDCKEGKYVCV